MVLDDGNPENFEIYKLHLLLRGSGLGYKNSKITQVPIPNLAIGCKTKEYV